MPVTLGTQKTVQSVLASENALLLEKSRANGLTQAVSLPESIDAPVEEGDIFDANGTPVASLPLLAGESIPHLTWSELFCRLLKLAYCGV